MIRKRLLSFLTLVAAAVSAPAQTAEMFQPYKQTDLRLPAVPIVVNDPYFSVWSPNNRLTGTTTRHWTDAEKPIDGMLRVDGVTYRFLGQECKYVLDETIAPMTDEEIWSGKVSTETQTGTDWTKLDFDDSAWETKKAAFGSPGEYPRVNTPWEGNDRDIYVRRTVNLTAEDLAKDLYVIFSHDDVFRLYINGRLVTVTGETWLQGEVRQVSSYVKQALVEGENVIAAYCHNTTGGAYLDFGLYANAKTASPDIKTATQKSVDVLATNTYYTFTCGPVELDVVFTAPMLIDDLDLLSSPINYISYQVCSTDGQEHDVQFYLAASPEMAVNTTDQTTVSRYAKIDGLEYLSTGTQAQPVLGKGSDGICIDWGYFYIPAINGEVSLASTIDVENYFATQGKLPKTKRMVTSSKLCRYPTLAFTYDFGKITTGSNFAMLGYDEVWDIEFLNNRYKGYWARNGKNIYKAFEELRDNYADIMTRCRALDKRIYDDGLAAGNVKYAELLSGSYRHVIAAHKLFEGPNGNVYFFSKENNSGGFVNTVDLTYPESPLFLLYNPELQKGMMRSIFEYCRSDRWNFPFCCHDLGVYPHANGQRYSITSPDSGGGFGGNMPLEESGNMLTLCAMLSLIDRNTEFADQYWDTIKMWADYLAEYGQDPENQLCTDDFAGFMAHNANLAIKAIMGVAGFSEMARLKGDIATADEYLNKAKSMAELWKTSAIDGDHYKLALDRSGTWSEKYNMVWDKLWDLGMFTDVINTEIPYYLTKQERYGLPLDSRSDIAKSDWIMWTAAMSPDTDTFLKFLDPLYKYVNETSSRVPLSDWFNTKTGRMVGFKARSVIGGHWMKVLVDNFDKEKGVTLGITSLPSEDKGTAEAYYDMNGIRHSQPVKGLNIVKYSDGSTRKVMNK